MQTYDLSLIQQDLKIMEQRLNEYGANPIQAETSLNTLFKNHLSSGGSRTRAMLAVAAGRATNLPDDARFAVATSIELLHQASLIHDDIQDKDALRRGQAAVWSIAGESSAICLGDELIGAAYEELSKLPAPYINELPRLIVMLSKGISLMAAGQTLDCQWTPATPITFHDYEMIVRHKSGPLLGLPIAMILTLVGGTDEHIEQVLAGASSIGVAYQLADDLSDKIEDQDSRLNGYWILAQQATQQDGTDPETELRRQFEWHLNNARECVQSLPPFCIQAFEVLIQALHEKYPSFRVAA
jgi:geranylgeranyl diphosphate synthase type II